MKVLLRTIHSNVTLHLSISPKNVTVIWLKIKERNFFFRRNDEKKSGKQSQTRIGIAYNTDCILKLCFLIINQKPMKMTENVERGISC